MHSRSQKKGNLKKRKLSERKIDMWKYELQQCKEWSGFIGTANRDILNTMEICVIKAMEELEKVKNHCINLQSKYRRDKINHLSKVNEMKEFTQKLLPKSNIAPVVHKVIKDAVSGKWKQCVNKAEQMQATKEHHEHWDDIEDNGDQLCNLNIEDLKDINMVLEDAGCTHVLKKRET